MNRVAIIDYGLCNLDSMTRAVARCGGLPVVTRSPDELATADRMILPGVGSFAAAMENLRNWSLAGAIREQVAKGTPLLGVCLGMHLLATRGRENGDTPGLGLIAGEVEKLEAATPDERIPHLGWNELRIEAPSDPLLSGVECGSDFYFVHSYHFVCRDRERVVATTPYGGGFASVVRRDRVVGTQFHPEKSQKHGLRLLENYLARDGGGRC